MAKIKMDGWHRILKKLNLEKKIVEEESLTFHSLSKQTVLEQYFSRAEDANSLTRAYLQIECALEILSESNNLEQDFDKDFPGKLFRDAASYFEAIAKGSYKNYKAEEGSVTKLNFNLLSGICYDLADLIANSRVMMERAESMLEVTAYLNFYDNLNWLIGKLIIYYFSRDIQSCKNVIKELYDSKRRYKVEKHYREVATDDKISIHSDILASYQLLECFNHLIHGYWESGCLESHEQALYYLKKSKSYYIDAENVVMYFCTKLLHVSVEYEKDRTIHALPDNKRLWIKYKGLLKSENIVDLWPPQTAFVKKNYLESEFSVVCTPTSSGKSLIAEFSIVNHFIREKEKKIVYLVPLRALATQVKKDLSKRLIKLDIVVERLVGGMEVLDLDPDLMNTANVLVLTPEKFRFLLNNKVIRTEQISSVIIDEGHNISLGTRGLDLEMLVTKLLSQMKHDMSILMLSAVTRNPEDLNSWLNYKNGGNSPLNLEWKPTGVVHALLTKKSQLIFYDQLAGLKPKIDVPSFNNATSRERTVDLARIFHQHGMVMIYGYAKKECEAIAEVLYSKLKGEQTKIVNREASDEIELYMGKNGNLAKYVSIGIAYHHGDLPDHIRLILEKLMREDKIRFIVATTTLAEGINSPISSIIIPRLKTGPDDMKNLQLKNLSGRAGRAMEHTKGYVVFIESNSVTKEDVEKRIMSSSESLEEVKSVFEELAKEQNAFDKYSYLLQNNDKPESREWFLRQRDKAQLNLWSTGKQLITAIADRVYDGGKLGNFLQRTYFGYRVNHNKSSPTEFKFAIKCLLGQLKDLEEMDYASVQRRSPYRVTDFGYACYRAGLLPRTMNDLAIGLSKLLKQKSITNLLRAQYYDESLKSELIELFRLIFLSYEIKLSTSIDEESKNKGKAEAIFDWIEDASVQKLQQYFLEKDSYSLAVQFSKSIASEYGAWVISGVLQILQLEEFREKTELKELGVLIEQLPFFLSYGTTSLLNGLFQLFEISPRSPVLTKITRNLEQVYLKDGMNRELNSVLSAFLEFKYEHFFYKDLKKTETLVINRIWTSYEEFTEQRGGVVEQMIQTRLSRENKSVVTASSGS